MKKIFLIGVFLLAAVSGWAQAYMGTVNSREQCDLAIDAYLNKISEIASYQIIKKPSKSELDIVDRIYDALKMEYSPLKYGEVYLADANGKHRLEGYNLFYFITGNDTYIYWLIKVWIKF
jgi:hypothetical protein